MHTIVVRRAHQCGAVIVTAALTMLLLLGFMAFALDFGKLFVVKTELQTAMDSCALAAAQELDGTDSAINRARSAGTSAGNLNKVNFQSPTWSDKEMIVPATSITFRNDAYAATEDPLVARYAQCQHTQPAVQLWLLQAMGAFSGAPGTYPNTQNVVASAVATRGSAQSACIAIPVSLKPKVGGTAPNYGFQVGEWVTVYGNKVPGSGELGWYNLDGSTNANQTKIELSESSAPCNISAGRQLGTPGAQTTADTPWNYRFGIYKNGDGGPSVNHPDFTGYSYTSTNWKNAVPQNAYAGTPATGSHSSAANYLEKSAVFASFDDTGTDLKHGSGIVFGDEKQMNSFKYLATPGVDGQHQEFGYSRRVVTVPVLDATSKIIDFACMFMLHPLSGPHDDGHLEFLGNAKSVGTPCVASGEPGGIAGPLVPVLVR